MNEDLLWTCENKIGRITSIHIRNGLDYQDMDKQSDELRNLPDAKSNPEEGSTEKIYNSRESLAENRSRLVWNRLQARFRCTCEINVNDVWK